MGALVSLRDVPPSLSLSLSLSLSKDYSHSIVCYSQAVMKLHPGVLFHQQGEESERDIKTAIHSTETSLIDIEVQRSVGRWGGVKDDDESLTEKDFPAREH
jgi:hypothetical protein